jgi:hypothetical protein
MDTALQVAFIGVAAVDRYQTANWDEEKYHEVGWARPFIGDHPKSGDVNRYFMLGVAAHTAIAVILPKPYRTIWQSFWLGVEVNAVHNNYQLGLSMRVF